MTCYHCPARLDATSWRATDYAIAESILPSIPSAMPDERAFRPCPKSCRKRPPSDRCAGDAAEWTGTESLAACQPLGAGWREKHPDENSNPPHQDLIRLMKRKMLIIHARSRGRFRYINSLIIRSLGGFPCSSRRFSCCLELKFSAFCQQSGKKNYRWANSPLCVCTVVIVCHKREQAFGTNKP